MKQISLLVALFIGLTSVAQSINMPTTGTVTITSCSGNIYDSGGPNGTYSINNDGVLVIDNGPNAAITLTRVGWLDLEYTDDYLYIYSGVYGSGTETLQASLTGFWTSSYSVTLPAGPVSLRFVSDAGSPNNYSGFQFSFSNNITGTPTASLPAGLSVNFNTPTTFNPTITNAASVEWDFGDGTTSTDWAPTHSFTSSGTKTVTLNAYSCGMIDTATTTMTVTVGMAPSISLSSNPISMTVPCGTSGTEYWTLTNAVGAGVFTASFTPYDTLGPQKLDFESGTEGAYALTGTPQFSHSTVAASGLYGLEITNTTIDTDDQIILPLREGGPGFQPKYFAYKTRASSSAWRAVKVHARSGQNGGVGGSVFGYTFWDYLGRLGIRVTTTSGYQTFYYINKGWNTWVQVEYRNINWVNATFDLYIDNAFYMTGSFMNAPNAQPNANYVQHVSITSDDLTDKGYVDDIIIGDPPQNSSLSMSPSSITILGGNNGTIALTFDATNKNAGNYTAFIAVASSDTLIDGDTLLVNVAVTGEHTYNTSRDTVDFANVSVGRLITESVGIYNTGCDSMRVDSIVFSSTDFTANLASIAPDDSVGLNIDLVAGAAGSIDDSLMIYTADTTYVVYLTGEAVNTPVLTMADTIVYTYTGCPDSLDIPFTIYNTGEDTLQWAEGYRAEIFEDDFEDNIGTDFWYDRNWVQSSCGVLNGSFSNRLSISYNELVTNPMDCKDGGTIRLTVGTGICYSPSNVLSNALRVAYRVSGGVWTDIHSLYPNGQTLNLTIPAAAKTSATEFKIYVSTSYLYGTWLVDDVSFILNRSVHFSPSSGSLASGDSVDVETTIYTGDLLDGVHYIEAAVATNDSLNLNKSFFIELHLDGRGQLVRDTASCLDFDTVFSATNVTDTAWLFNVGCDTLDISSITTTNAVWSAYTMDSTLAAGDSTQLFVTIDNPVTGTYNDSVALVYGDSTAYVCLTALVVDPPVAYLDTTSIVLSTVNCGDSVDFSFTIANSGTATMEYDIQPGAVLNVVVLEKFNFPILMANLYAELGNAEKINLVTETNALSLSNWFNWADVIILPATTTAATTNFFTNVNTILDPWVQNGGNLIILGGPNLSGYTSNLSFWDGYSPSAASNMDIYVNYSFINDTIVKDLPQGYFTSEPQAFTTYGSGGSDFMVYRRYTSATVVRRTPYGQGSILFNGFTLQTLGGQGSSVLQNTLLYYRGRKSQNYDWLTLSPTSGVLASNDSTTISGTVYSDDLVAGTYNTSILLNSNDPVTPTQWVNLTFTVNGQGEPQWDATGCMAFGSIYQNIDYSDSVLVHNVGCDTLSLSGWATHTSSVTANSASIDLAPGDSAYIAVTVNKSTIGSLSDSIALYTDVDTLYKCITASVLGAPVCTVTPSSLSAVINKCNTFKTENITIQNTGVGTLNFTDIEVKETYDSTSTKYWTTYSSSVLHNFADVLVVDTLWFEMEVNGGYSQTYNYFYFYINGYYFGTFYDNDLSDGTTDKVRGYFTGTTLQNAFNTNTDLSIYAYRQSWTYNGGTDISKLRIYGSKPATWASPVGATAGNLIPNQSVTKGILLNASSLAVGTYTSNVVVTSNDPANPTVSIPLTLEVVSQPDLELQTNLQNMGFVMGTTPVTDSIYLQNVGCGDLIISSVSSSNAKFVPGWTTKTVPSGNTTWLPWTFTGTTSGAETGVFTILSNDTADALTITANVVFPAQADYVYTVLNGCSGQVSFQNNSSNGVDYLWAFGDNQFSQDASPVHTFEKPGIYNVMLVASNAGSSDTLYQSVDMSDVLYVAAEFADTVKRNTTVQFIDSSQVPTSWQWYFGDGANSTLQNPTHTYTALGTYIVTLQVTNAAGCSASVNTPIQVVSQIGLEEIDQRFGLYPNPTAGVLNFETDRTVEAMRIYDARGALIYSGQFLPLYDTQHLAPGAYRAVLIIDGQSTSATFQVVR
ncbi:MAG: hypothetical protein RL754_1378 [Bacteroidota bacterium]